MDINTANIKTLLRKSTSRLLIALLKEQITSTQNIDTLNRSNALELIPKHEVKKVDAWAETINILSDHASRKAVDAIWHLFNDKMREGFNSAGNQYDRALWLYKNNKALFYDAVKIRFELENGTSEFSSFQAKKNTPHISRHKVTGTFLSFTF